MNVGDKRTQGRKEGRDDAGRDEGSKACRETMKQGAAEEEAAPM